MMMYCSVPILLALRSPSNPSRASSVGGSCSAISVQAAGAVAEAVSVPRVCYPRLHVLRLFMMVLPWSLSSFIAQIVAVRSLEAGVVERVVDRYRCSQLLREKERVPVSIDGTSLPPCLAPFRDGIVSSLVKFRRWLHTEGPTVGHWTWKG